MTPLVEAVGVGIPGRLESSTLRLAGGELTGVIGPNGGGKTSLLRAIAGVEGSSGRVTVAGEELREAPPARRERLLAFLPATRELVWAIKARDLIELTAAHPGAQPVRAVVEDLELVPLLDRPVSQLSTGERARVLLARALAARPRLLLLDEPLSNLDPYWVIRVLGAIGAYVRSSGAAALVSLHDLHLIEQFDRILGIAGGRVVVDQSPEQLIAGPVIGDMFGVERGASGWTIRPADRRSSP